MPKVLYDETAADEETDAFSMVGLMETVYAKGEDFYDSIPDVEFSEPVVVIAEVSDGCGNLTPACWELSGRMLASCFEPVDTFHSYYVDENRDLHSIWADLRNGTSYYLYRVFKEGISRDGQQWLIDLINCAAEIGTDIREEIDRCTLPVGIQFAAAGGR